MAAGSEVPQKGVLQASGYQPVETRLNPPIQLPGTGELWAKVGQTALAAAGQLNDTAKMIQASPLNPNVQAQQDYMGAQADAAQEHLDWLKSQGRYGQMVQGTTPQGLETIPAGGAGVNNMLAMRLMKGPPKPEAPAAPAAPKEQEKPTPQQQGQSDFEQHPEYYYQNPSTGNYERRADAPPLEQPKQQPKQSTTPEPKNLPENPGDLLSSTRVPSQGGSTAALSAGGDGILNTGQPQSSDIVATPASQPSGSIWSPQRPAPLAPAAPSEPPAQPPPDQGSSPAAATKADQVAMQQWQQQNAHPVMSSQDALAWMKTQTTLAQDATYLPMGGPGGAPAFAFHMKGGGINTVPVSQMVSRGGGPLVASQNTSQVISATDQAQQGGNQGGAAPTDQPQMQPAGQVSGAPTGTADQPWGPPAAPTGPLAQASPPPPGPIAPAAPGMRDIQGNPLSAYTNVPSKGGLSAEQLGAQTTSAGQPAQPVANPVVNAAAPAVADTSIAKPQVSQEDADANIFTNVKSPAELAKLDEDPIISNWAGYTWKQDRQYGNVYAVMRSPTNIFRVDRYDWGKEGWQDSPTEKSANQQELHDIVASTPGINYTDPQIAKMSLPDIMAAINEGKKFNATKSDPAGQTEMMLTGKAEVSKIVQRIIDQVEAAKKSGMNPNDFRGAVLEASKQAGERNQVMPVQPGQQLEANLPPNLAFELGAPKDFATDFGQAWPMAQAAFHGALSGASGHQPNQFVNNLGQEFQNLNKIGAGTTGVFVRSNEQPGSAVNFNGIQLPVSGKVSDINELAQVFQGVDYDTMLKGLNTFKKRMDDSFADSFDSAKSAGYRVNNNQRAAREAVKNNQPIADNSNLFKDGTIPKELQPSTKTTTTTVTPPAGPHVYQDTTEPGFFRATKQSAPVALDDEQGVRNFMKTKPSGTYFRYQGQDYMVP